MTIAYNKDDSKETRRILRRDQPTPEHIIWSKLRNRQLSNSKWRRQYSIGKFIVDFYCPEKKLAVEIDGDSHYNPLAEVKDKERERYINSFGVRFLRFTNVEVMKNLEGVLSEINNSLFAPHPASPYKGEGNRGSHLTLPLVPHPTSPCKGEEQKERNQ